MLPGIEKIIVKYLTKSATANELDTLSVWIENAENLKIFKDFVQTHYAIHYNTDTIPDTEKTLEKLLFNIRREKSIKHRFHNRPIYKYAIAAVFVIGLVTASFYWEHKKSNIPVDNGQIVTNTIQAGTDKAVLTLGDGSKVALEKGESFKTNSARSDGQQIVYDGNARTDHSKIVYNYLTIPRGGQFFIKLSDGTQIWLNSESQLKYPVTFIKGKTREVELVYGEAYFDVSPSSENRGTKFKVINNKQVVEVLGTEFNIKAYKDESNIYTTLVEGKVQINTSTTNQILAPNEQSNVNTINNDLMVTKVDVDTEISWKNGYFSFKGKSLKEIMKVISRWYNVDVIFENKELESIKFKGIIYKSQGIEEILSIMKSNTINSYQIKDKSIILK